VLIPKVDKVACFVSVSRNLGSVETARFRERFFASVAVKELSGRVRSEAGRRSNLISNDTGNYLIFQ